MQELNFINELEKSLAALPASQREEVLNDYRNHFEEGRLRGKTDEEISAALGGPKALARAFVADFHLNRIYQPAPGQPVGATLFHLLRALFAMISILAVNFFFVLWPVLGVAFFLGTSWIFAVLTAALGLGVSLTSIFGSLIIDSATVGLSAKLAVIFYSFSAAGAAMLTCLGLYFLSRWFLIGLMKYIKLNINIVLPN